MKTTFINQLILFCIVTLCLCCKQDSDNTARSTSIQPYALNPMYWEYQSKPVLLLGGSSDDNIFQHPSADLDAELDRLVAHGGNYLRWTLSSRDQGNDYPFHFDSTKMIFDLNQWNDVYWEKLDYFFRATKKRKIIVQLEVWETYDFYTRQSHVFDGQTAWDKNPFNPRNNTNYTEAESGLSSSFKSNGYELINSFFNTVLPLHQPFDFDVKPVVLSYQQKFVDKLLSISLQYDHVLYVMDNETNADPKWSKYWSQYVKFKAGNNPIQVTEIWDTFDPTDGKLEGIMVQNPANHFFTLRSGVSNTLYDHENYSFVDISNHNAQKGEDHYKTGLYVWNEVHKSGHKRPINNTKIYGNPGGWAGTPVDGQERFWRNIFSGAASVRFHRPPAGLGNSDIAMAHVRSMRMLSDSIHFFSAVPSNELLTEREDDEAFCLATAQNEYAVFFTNGGAVGLNVKPGSYQVSWLNILSSTWQQPKTISLPEILYTPDNGFWVAKVVKVN